MKRLESMKEILMTTVQGQLGHIDSVDTKELGEAIDMIKDLSEAIYYCTITEAMGKQDKEKEEPKMYYQEPRMYYPESRMTYYDPYRMYYEGGNSNGGGSSSSGNSNGSSGNSRSYYSPVSDYRDPREGRSFVQRKYYMESKEQHHDKTKQMKELESYMQELTHDITEMIKGATPDEIALLKQKLSTLNEKIK